MQSHLDVNVMHDFGSLQWLASVFAFAMESLTAAMSSIVFALYAARAFARAY